MILLLLFISWASLATANDFRCKSCFEQIWDVCPTENTVTCADNSGCLMISGFAEYGATRYKTIAKRCKADVDCGSWLCISSKPFKLQSYLKCCAGEECNVEEYFIPVDDETDNGLVCPSCYIEGTLDGCQPDDVINCRGDEDRCVAYSGTVLKDGQTEAEISFKACSNPLAYSNFSLFTSLKEIKRKSFTVIPKA